MEHEERYYLLMMDALDGELAVTQHAELEAHLRACPACSREWQALLAIEMLLRQAPILSPAAGFAGRTLARLPNRRARMWALSSIYALLLLSGIVPLLIGAVLVTRYIAILREPSVLGQIGQFLLGFARVIVTVIDALLAGSARMVAEQPALIGWLVVLAGIVFLWGGVYQRLLAQPTRSNQRS